MTPWPVPLPGRLRRRRGATLDRDTIRTSDAYVEGIDSSIISHPRTWQASGHVEHFSDPLVDCRACKRRFHRA